MINIVICDDDVMIRESLKVILSSDDMINVAAICENGRECIDIIEKHTPDVLLLDMRMPIMSGCETLRIIHDRALEVKTLVLTTFDEDEFIISAIQNGACGYLLKTSKPDKIISAIKSVAEGNGLFEIEIISSMFKSSASSGKNLSALTDRENEIAGHIAQGMSNKDISKALYLSEGTVKNHISSILMKLELKHRTQIAIMYINK